jgi:hypothetical protein
MRASSRLLETMAHLSMFCMISIRRVPVSKLTICFQNRYKHPYEAEILSMQYPDRLFQILDPIPPQPVETTSATWVDTYEGVVDMLQELKQAKEIAVDLEHHDFRTYIGLVSLLQISTREKDWVVDTLKPWRHKLQVLNEVFADPTIVKVRILLNKCFLCCLPF